MSDVFVEIPLTPPIEVEASALMSLYDAYDTISLVSGDSTATTLVNENEPVNPPNSEGSTNRNPEATNRALASMVFNPDAAPAPATVESEPTSDDEPPLILSTEAVEELVLSESESEQPTRYTVAQLLNTIEEYGIELPDSDDEDNLGQEGAGLGDLDEDEVLAEIAKWEMGKKAEAAAKAKAEAEGEGSASDDEDSIEAGPSAAAKGKAKATEEEIINEGKGKGRATTIDDDDDASVYSQDDPATTTDTAPKLTSAQRKKKRKGGKKHRHGATTTTTTAPTTAPTVPPFLARVNAHLARGEHVVDTKKVLREAEEAEARGEDFDMIGRIKALQDGSAPDSGPLVNAFTPWFEGKWGKRD